MTGADAVGTWVVPTFSSSYRVTGNFLGQDLDDRGSSEITASDLQMVFTEDGSWTSSGDYTLTVTTESETDVTRQSGVGEGSWSFRNDSLYVTGLLNFNGSGEFAEEQAFAIDRFSRDIEIGMATTMDHTGSNADYGIDIRTRGDWSLVLLR